MEGQWRARAPAGRPLTLCQAQLLLYYLPEDRSQWASELARKRALYAGYRVRLPAFPARLVAAKWRAHATAPLQHDLIAQPSLESLGSAPSRGLDSAATDAASDENASAPSSRSAGESVALAGGDAEADSEPAHPLADALAPSPPSAGSAACDEESEAVAARALALLLQAGEEEQREADAAGALGSDDGAASEEDWEVLTPSLVPEPRAARTGSVPAPRQRSTGSDVSVQHPPAAAPLHIEEPTADSVAPESTAAAGAVPEAPAATLAVEGEVQDGQRATSQHAEAAAPVEPGLSAATDAAGSTRQRVEDDVSAAMRWDTIRCDADRHRSRSVWPRRANGRCFSETWACARTLPK